MLLQMRQTGLRRAEAIRLTRDYPCSGVVKPIAYSQRMAEALIPEHRLALAYCPATSRDWLRALLALDAMLGDAARLAREPMLGALRLAWWAQRISDVAAGQTPVEPVLVDLVATAPARARIAPLSEIAHGWRAVVEPVLDDAARRLHADSRGSTLFAALAESPDSRAAGAAWALSELAVQRQDRDAQRLASAALAAIDRRALRQKSLPLWVMLLTAQARLESHGALWLSARLIGGAIVGR